MINGHRNIDKLEPLHQSQHKALFDFAQGIIEKTFTSVPDVDQIPNGYMAKYLSGTTYRIYINISGELYYWNLTKV